MAINEKTSVGGKLSGSGIRKSVKVLVSLQKIRFSYDPEDYLEVTTDVFFNGLLYLLFVKKITSSKEFELINANAKEAITNMLDSEIKKLSLASAFHDFSVEGYLLNNKKILLLKKAILFLQSI